MTTIKDVAKMAEVSIATVSRVINNGPKVGAKTRAKVQAVMDELGFRPNQAARSLVMQRSQTIGVVIPELTDPFFASLAQGIDQVAREQHMQMLLSTGASSAESERQAINTLVDRRCHVIVLHSKRLPDSELVTLCEKFPALVIIDRYIEAIAERCIWLDNLEGGRIAARHLLALGHKELACITSHYDIEDPKERLQGFQQTIQSHGLQLANELLQAQEPNQQGGQAAAQQLIASNKPFSAIFVYNDAMAIGAISTLEDNGYCVPRDVSVIGFDDVLLARYSRPKLSTLHYPIEKMAIHAAELACALANQQEKEGEQAYVPYLVKRESTVQQ